MEIVPLADRNSEEVLDGTHLAQLAAGDKMSLQHYQIDPGAYVDTHDHHHEQLGYIISGTLTFIIDGEELPVGPDESFVIPSNEPHAAENRGDEPVIGVELFSPPRPKPPWAD